ncbi:MAG: tRNA pseudouridine(38-40) synthase TruA [Planctomycetota bacterium]
MPEPRTFKLTIAYDGTELSGWQIQPGRSTVQGQLERVIAKLVGQRVGVVGSGRTDAGVHALAQVASCTLPHWSGTEQQLGRAINTGLPDSILVTEVETAPEDFHAIRDSKAKRYRYQIQNGGQRNPFDHRFWFRLRRPVNVDAVAVASQVVVGCQDFASFQATGAVRKTTVRTVTACEVIELPVGPWGEPRLAIEVEADGFLYNMVRNIVGTVLEVGSGKRSVQWVEDVIKARNRDLAGPTAPACGLFLKWVRY